MLILCDIDGTAANIDHRRHYVENKPKRWDKFFKEMINDAPNVWCQKLLHALVVDGHKVIFISGRPGDYRTETELWLGKHYTAAFNGELYMRPAGNSEPDYIIKERIYNDYFVASDSVKEIMLVIDDRKQVVDMWRSKGLTVLQCDEGNF